MSELKDSKKNPETSPESPQPPEQPEDEQSPEEMGQQMVEQGSQAVTSLKQEALDNASNIATRGGTEVDSETQASLHEQANQADEALSDMASGVEETAGVRSVTSRHSIKTEASLPEKGSYVERKKEMTQVIVGQVQELHQLAISESTESLENHLETVRNKLMSILERLSEFTQQVDPLDKANEDFFDSLGLRTIDMLNEIKQESGAEISQIFSDVYYEHSDFLDREVVIPLEERQLQDGAVTSTEHVARKIYKRTPEEMEQIKSRNRESVVQAIQEMSEKPDITTEMLEELYRLNNKGVVPAKLSAWREGSITFGKRIGTVDVDIPREVSHTVDRANKLTLRRIFGMSETAHDMAAAKLHNDLLDIHPWEDRNGSTSLLFLELMMTREGRYEPSAEREKDYYKQLHKIFDGNLLAMGVVLYEQIKIANSYGYYEGVTPIDDTRKEFYGDRITHWKEKYKERRKKKAKKKAA